MKNFRCMYRYWVIVIFSFLWGYSFVSATDMLTAAQEQHIAVLDLVEEKVLDVFEKIEEKTTNKEISTQIIDTQEEIQLLIEQQQEAIQQTETLAEVSAIMQETKERIILKTYDAITDHDSVGDSIRVPGGVQEQEEAIAVALDQIVEPTTITLQIKTDSSPVLVKQAFMKYDTITINELFSTDDIHYLEVSFPKDGLIAQELFSEVEEGSLPDTILGYHVVKPEVYTIGQINLGSEQVAYLRGAQRFQSPLYIEALSNATIAKVHVGVIDTGIDRTHPDLAGAISQTIPGYDFVNDDTDPMDDHQHGTHVAGVIAAQANGSGVVGINPAIELVPLKICTKTGYCPSYAISNAIRYAADHGIEVLNMSLGGAGTLVNNPTCAAISYATEHLSIVVAAAGNANTNAVGFIPAACPQTITVGAVDSTLKRASFSNYGTEVNISAPGVGIYSTLTNGKWGFLDGTSMATPYISAVVATVRAIAGPMSTSEMQTRLLNHTLPVTFESDKPIGPFLDYPSLMQSLSIPSNTVLCGTNPCFGTTAGSGVVAVAEQTGTGITVQSNTTPLIQNGLTISYSSVGLHVKESLTITIEGGKSGYLFTKGSEKFGLGNRVNTTVSTNEGNKVKTTITLLGLQPGTTELLIQDIYTNKEVRLPITVTENILITKVGEKIGLNNGSFWNLGTITFSGNNGHLVKTQDGGGFYQEYTVKKSGIIYMTVAISNTYENKTQYMVYEIRSSADPITADTSLLSLKVGRYANDIKIGGGAPPYTVKKGSTNLGFWMKSSDITLASANGGSEIVFSDTETSPEQSMVIGAVTIPCETADCKEPIGDDVEIRDLFAYDESQVQEGLDIANTVFSFAVLPLTPGVSFVTVSDADGSTLTIPVSIEPADLAIKLNNQVGWYYNNTAYNYEIKSVTSSHPGIVAVTYSSQTYIATAKANGYATLTFAIYNKTEQRNQTMQIQVIAGSPQALEFTGTKTEVTVGETVELQIKGGMGPYKITKTNENVALGFGSDTAPISVAGGLKQVASIQLPQKGDALPATTLPALSSLIHTTPDGAVVNLIDPEELSGSSEIYVQGIMPINAPITVEGIHTVRIMGLQPGATTITVTDADGISRQLPITVTPKKMMIDAADHKTVLLSTITHPGRWDVKQITSTTFSVKPRTDRGIIFLKGQFIASGSLSVHIYNRHESKKQTLVYETEVIGPTYEQYLKAIEQAIARAQAQSGAKKSSITASDLINAGLDPCYSVNSCAAYRAKTNPGGGKIVEQQIAEDKSVVTVSKNSFSMSAGQMTVIDVTRHSENTLTLQYDPTKLIVKKYTGPGKLQATATISETDTGSSDDRFGGEIYEVVDAPSDMYILNNGLHDGNILYEQYVVMGKPGDHQVRFSSRYGREIESLIYYADKVFTLQKGIPKTSKLYGLPLVSAYSSNSGIVHTEAYFQLKNSNGIPIGSSRNDTITVHARNYGDTVLHREFDPEYSGPTATELKVLDIKVQVPDPSLPNVSWIKKRTDTRNNMYYGGEVWEPVGATPTTVASYKSVVEKKLKDTYALWNIGWENQEIGGYVICTKYSAVVVSCRHEGGNILLSETSGPLRDSVNRGGYNIEFGSFTASAQAVQYLTLQVRNKLIEQDMILKQGSIVFINMYKNDDSQTYRTKIAQLAYHLNNGIQTVRNNIDFPALLGYLQEELPLLAQTIAIGMREDMLDNPIRFILDFTAIGDIISIVEYIQGFDLMSEVQKYINGSVIGVGLILNTSKSGDDAFKKVIKDFYTAEDYLKLVNRNTVVTHGMIDAQKHYKKHGINDFIKRGLEPVSAQQYFDDSIAFRNLNKNDVSLKQAVNIYDTQTLGWRIVDSTGRGGIYHQDGLPITFFYFPL